MRIPVLPADECSTCTRRSLLRGIGVVIAGSFVASACGPAASGGVDAPPTPPDGGASCPTGDLCIDITKSPNTALANVNGSIYVHIATDTLIIIRTSSTAVVALSSVCTHAGVQVQTQSSTSAPIICPAHGAEFTLTGTVVRGPASRPLKMYNATLAGNIVTIVGA